MTNASTISRRLVIASIACWLLVVFAHVAERWHLWPGMGWGLPDSPGHYLDLASAIGSAVLLAAAFIARQTAIRDRRKG